MTTGTLLPPNGQTCDLLVGGMLRSLVDVQLKLHEWCLRRNSLDSTWSNLSESKFKTPPPPWLPACFREPMVKICLHTDSSQSFPFSPSVWINSCTLYSQEEVYFGGDGLTAGGGEVVSLDRCVGHACPNFLHHVLVEAVAALAEFKVSAAFDVASPQRQERNKACDELLLNDAGVEEATLEGEREGEVDGETRISACFISSSDGRPGYYNFTFYSRCHDD